LYALLIVTLVFIIAMSINILYVHNSDDNGLEIRSAHGALPQKPSFGAGMAYSTAISIQIHGVDFEPKGLTVPKIFSPEIFGKKTGSTTTPVGGAVDIDNLGKKTGSTTTPASPKVMPMPAPAPPSMPPMIKVR
jgi:predicted membrane protein